MIHPSIRTSEPYSRSWPPLRGAGHYLIEYAEGWASERCNIREDKVLGSLDRLHELTAQAAN